MNKNAALTQAFSTWGDKLLQHCDALGHLQYAKQFRPITVQLAPTEACDSDCPFCSVGNRPKGRIPWTALERGLKSWAILGAKSVEITGGGNPLLYRDGDKSIADVVHLCRTLSLKVGVITNSERPVRFLTSQGLGEVEWVRVSLAKLDEGLNADGYDFAECGGKLGLSYIFHTKSRPDILQEIRHLLDLWPMVKFVRLAPDCTTDDALTIEARLGDAVRAIDPEGKCFLKDIGSNYHPYSKACWVGGFRPYWTSTGVYICTSHVLKTRKYEPEWKLCDIENVGQCWADMAFRMERGEKPYDIDISKCWHCYYFNSNAIIDKIMTPMPDKDFA